MKVERQDENNNISFLLSIKVSYCALQVDKPHHINIFGCPFKVEGYGSAGLSRRAVLANNDEACIGFMMCANILRRCARRVAAFSFRKYQQNVTIKTISSLK